MQTQNPDIPEIAQAFVDGYPHLSPGDQHLALTVYRLLTTGQPATPDAVAEAAGQPIDNVRQRLDAWPAVFRNKDGAVTGFWGLTIEELTSHRLDLDTGTLWTWCAYDTLFIPHLLDITTPVSSVCPTTGGSVRLTVSPDGVAGLDPAGAVVSLLTPDKPFDDDVRQSLCHFVHFFVSPDAAAAWTADHPGTFWVSVEDAYEIARRQNAAVYPTVVESSPSA